jgi:hypothetical protein
LVHRIALDEVRGLHENTHFKVFACPAALNFRIGMGCARCFYLVEMIDY